MRKDGSYISNGTVLSSAINFPLSNTISTSIFTDLSKAFDTINIAIMLHKLDHNGVRVLSNDCFCFDYYFLLIYLVYVNN